MSDSDVGETLPLEHRKLREMDLRYVWCLMNSTLFLHEPKAIKGVWIFHHIMGPLGIHYSN